MNVKVRLENSDKTSDASQLFKKEFFEREYTFRTLLEPYVNLHGPKLHFPEVGDAILGFKTCFSLGLGSSTSPGSGTNEQAWYNLRKTEFQPNLIVVNEKILYTCYSSSLCSVLLNQSLCISVRDESPITIPIFICELSLDPGEVVIFLLTISVRN